MAASDDRIQDTNDYRDPQNMMWLWGQLMMIPAAALVYSVEMLLRTMHGMQQVTNQGLTVMVGPTAGTHRMFDEQDAPDTQPTGSRISNTNNRNEEDTLNNNTDYNYCNQEKKTSNCLKLWRYKVLFIKRDLEHAFDEAEDLVPDDVQDITAWKIAEFIQRLAGKHYRVPGKWLDNDFPKLKYLKVNGEEPASYQEARKARDAGTAVYLTGLDEDDKRYLRLFSQVLAQYTREEPQYDKEQIKVLREIANKLG
jgi:hypothetical protein